MNEYHEGKDDEVSIDTHWFSAPRQYYILQYTFKIPTHLFNSVADKQALLGKYAIG